VIAGDFFTKRCLYFHSYYSDCRRNSRRKLSL